MIYRKLCIVGFTYSIKHLMIVILAIAAVLWCCKLYTKHVLFMKIAAEYSTRENACLSQAFTCEMNAKFFEDNSRILRKRHSDSSREIEDFLEKLHDHDRKESLQSSVKAKEMASWWRDQAEEYNRKKTMYEHAAKYPWQTIKFSSPTSN